MKDTWIGQMIGIDWGVCPKFKYLDEKIPEKNSRI